MLKAPVENPARVFVPIGQRFDDAPVAGIATLLGCLVFLFVGGVDNAGVLPPHLAVSRFVHGFKVFVNSAVPLGRPAPPDAFTQEVQSIIGQAIGNHRQRGRGGRLAQMLADNVAGLLLDNIVRIGPHQPIVAVCLGHVRRHLPGGGEVVHMIPKLERFGVLVFANLAPHFAGNVERTIWFPAATGADDVNVRRQLLKSRNETPDVTLAIASNSDQRQGRQCVHAATAGLSTLDQKQNPRLCRGSAEHTNQNSL